jgi:hypothetical protein
MLGMSLFTRPLADSGEARSCPACHDLVASGEMAVTVRGMRFHSRCARYRVRARHVPRTLR